MILSRSPKEFRNFVTFDVRNLDDKDATHEPPKFYQKTTLTRAWEAKVPFVIQTPEGEFDEQPAGTFIAEDANGNFYPIAADVMEKTYRQVSGEGGRERNLSSYSAEELIRELKERPQAIDNILFAVSAGRLIAEIRNRKGDEIVAIFLQMLEDEVLSNELTNRGYVVNVR